MMNHWMFRCQDVSRKVSRSMDASLPLHERMAVRFHLFMCRYCSLFRDQLRQIREMSGLVDTDLPGCETDGSLSEECRDRIKAALRNQR